MYIYTHMNKVDMDKLHAVLFQKAGDLSITEDNLPVMAEIDKEAIKEGMDSTNVSEADLIRNIQETGKKIDKKEVTGQENKERVLVLNEISRAFQRVNEYKEHVEGHTLRRTGEHKKSLNKFCNNVADLLEKTKPTLINTLESKQEIPVEVKNEPVVKSDLKTYDSAVAVFQGVIADYNGNNMWKTYKNAKKAFETISKYVDLFRDSATPARNENPIKREPDTNPYVRPPTPSPPSSPTSPYSSDWSGLPSLSDEESVDPDELQPRDIETDSDTGWGFNIPLNSNKDVLKYVNKVVSIKEHIKDPQYKKIQNKTTTELKSALKKMLKVKTVDNKLERNIVMVLSLLKIRNEIGEKEIFAVIMLLKRKPRV
jgi:hypothetical protein